MQIAFLLGAHFPLLVWTRIEMSTAIICLCGVSAVSGICRYLIIVST